MTEGELGDDAGDLGSAVGPLDAAADTLYAVAPSEFIARRKELVSQARSRGDKASATAIGQLRRPTVSAWLVNLVVRDDDSDTTAGVARLETVGDALREAQAALAGARMRELAGDRQALVASLARRAGELAVAEGQAVTASLHREIEETFGAAIADERAAAAVTSGRLTRALVYAGLGEVDLAEATATPVVPGRRLRAVPAIRVAAQGEGPPREAAQREAPTREKAKQPEVRGEEARRQRREQAERAVATATSALGVAEGVVATADEALFEARGAQQSAADRVDEIQRELAQARQAVVTADMAVARAEREQHRYERVTRDARQTLIAAERALRDLTE